MRVDGRWFLALPLLVGVVACGGGSDDGSDDGSDGDRRGGDGAADVEAARPEGFEASPAYLSAAIDASSGVPHRFEATVTLGERRNGDFEGLEDVPAMRGESDGVRSSSTSDPAEMADAMGGMPPELEDADLTTSVVTEGDIAYVHAPGYAEIDLPVDDTTPPIVRLAEELGDKWGRVDLTALGDDAGQLFSQLNGGQNLDPAFYLELVQAADQVEELGGDIVDGRAQIGLAADVPMAALLEAQGIDPEALAASAPPEFADLAESMTMAVEVWLDGDGRVRRLVMDMGQGLDDLVEQYDVEGEEAEVLTSMEIITKVTFSDHGDESIAVEVPAEADTVDVTESVRRIEAET
jgi:hypothetical protein